MLARDARLGYTARRDGVICADGIPLSIVAILIIMTMGICHVR